MITVEPTRDANWMWETVQDPAMWKSVGGSSKVTYNDVRQQVSDERNYFIAVKNGNNLGGFIPFLFKNAGEYEMHLCLVNRGWDALEGCRNAVHWMFESTPAKQITAIFPRTRKDVRLFCGWTGFKVAWSDDDTVKMILEKGK